MSHVFKPDSLFKNYYFHFNFFDERSIFLLTLIGLGDTKRNKEREKTPAEKHTVLSQVGTLTLASLALWKRRQENHLDLRPKDRKTGNVSQGCREWAVNFADVETDLSRVGDRSPLMRRLTHLKQCLPHCRKDRS